MDVSCPQCQTVYEVDELNAYSAAVSLQCSQCNFVFRLNAARQAIQENLRRWMIRTHVSGDILYFNTFDVLHRWIMDGTVTGEDAISRTGERWMELRNIGEFAPIFQTVESIAKIADTRSSASEGPTAVLPMSSSKPKPQPVTLSPTEEVVTKVIPELQPGPSTRTHTLPFGVPAASRKPVITAEARKPTPVSAAPHAPRVVPMPAPAIRAQYLPSQRSNRPDYPENTSETDDAWSFGTSLPPLDDRETANSEPTQTWGFYDINAAARRSRRRRNILLGLTISVVVGCGVAAYFAQEPLLAWWNSTFAPSDVIKLGDSVADESSARKQKTEESAVNTPKSAPVDDVLFTTSSEQISNALVRADEQQKQYHQEAQARAKKPAKNRQVVEEDDESASGDKNNVSAVLSRAKTALERGNTARARQLYHQAVRLDPQNAEAISGLGWSLLAIGNADSARAQFLRAKYRDPDFDGSYIGLGRAERELGNLEGALKAYEDYISRFPDGSQVTIARYQSQELKRQLGK